MTTLTLKLAWGRSVDPEPGDGSPAGTFDMVQWKAGVSSVQRLDRGFYCTMQDVIGKHGSGVAVHAELLIEHPGGGKVIESKILTLLSVYYGEPGDAARSHWELILVEKAWLLSATGDTIERVAP